MKKPKNAQKVDTMAQAATLADVDPAVIRFAKRSGCDAFNHGRVDISKLKAWLTDHADEIANQPAVTKEQVQIKLGLQKLARGEWEWDVEKGKYLKRDEVCESIRQIAQHQRLVLQRKLESELPPKLLGLGVVEITEKMKATVDEVCRILNDRTQQWTT